MPEVAAALDSDLAGAEDAASRSLRRRDALREAEELVRRDPSRYAEYVALRNMLFDHPTAAEDLEAYRAELAREHGPFQPTAADAERSRRLRRLVLQGSDD